MGQTWLVRGRCPWTLRSDIGARDTLEWGAVRVEGRGRPQKGLLAAWAWLPCQCLDLGHPVLLLAWLSVRRPDPGVPGSCHLLHLSAGRCPGSVAGCRRRRFRHGRPWPVRRAVPPVALGAPSVRWDRGSGLGVAVSFPVELKPCIERFLKLLKQHGAPAQLGRQDAFKPRVF